MADPIVHITNGTPDSGTGNITTLGQTLLDGVNVTYGATTDLAVAAGAAGSISAKLRSISRDIVGGVVLQAGANVIGAVTQSGGPWSVTGTLVATQSGTWNITNITGTVSLPTGAATSANQPSNAALASTTLGQTGNLSFGAASTTAPSYTNGQSNPLSLTTGGALRVDNSAVIQPISGTISISGTVAATQSGAWTMQPGNTPNSTPWLQTISQGGNAATVSVGGALKVDNSGVTQPVNGTVAATQSGTWNIGSISGAITLPTGAATAAKQPALGTAGTPSADVLSIQGVTSMIPLKVDASGTTQPISGTVAATQSGVWSSRTQDGSGNAITSDARGTARPLAVEILDASGNQITSFGGAGGTSSNFGAANPTAGTAAGYTDGANMQLARVFDGDTGVGTQYSLGVLLKSPGNGGAVDFGTASIPIRIDPTGSTPQPVTLTSTTITGTVAVTESGTWTVQPGNTANTTPWLFSLNAGGNTATVSAAGALKTDGSAVTQPVSGTISAVQSGAWAITGISGTVSLPTGASTAAKQPALGTAGTPSTDVLTVQGAVGMSALKVDGSGVTQPISGTLTANQGGNWTTRVVGNTGGILDFAGQNAAVPGNAILIGAEFNTTPTTITSGNASPLQLDASGNLLVNIKAGAGSGGTASTFGSAFPSSGTAIGAKDSSGTNMAALNLDASGFLKVNVAAGGASGGTSSSFGAAIPSTGTAGGFSDGTNMQLARVFDGDSGAGTQYSLGILLKTPQSGGAVDIGVSGQPLRIDPTGTTTQPVSMTSTTITGTVAATQSGTWNVTNISGTVSLPTGAATSANQPTAAAAASTSSGQIGNISMGFGTTSAPTYVNGQSNALSLNLAGGLRVDGSGVTQPVSGTFWQATQPVSLASTTITGTVAATQSGNWTSRVVGNAGAILDFAGSNVAAPANAILTGGIYQSTPPTLTAGNVSQLQLDANGYLRVNVMAGSGGGGGTSSTVGGAMPTSATVAMGSVTTSPPAYTTATANSLSLNTAGGLRVDGSGVTQPVSGTFWQTTQPVSLASTTITGTVAATQSGVWNVTNISGSITLPTGASTATLQPTNVGQGTSSGGQTGNLAMGTVLTAAPTYVTGQSNAISLTTAGAVRVDGSGVTQPVSLASTTITGTVAATQSGAWSVGQTGTWTVQPGNTANTTPWLTTARNVGNAGGIMDFAGQNAAQPANSLLVGAEFNTTPTTITSGNASPLQMDNLGNLKVNIQAGAGSGGTASTFGSAFPGQGTAIGVMNNAGTAMTNLSVNASNALKVDGSGVTQPVSGTIAVTGAVAVTGTFWQATQPVSGTFFQATQPISATALPLPAGAATAALQTTNAAIGSTTAGQTGQLQMAAVTTSFPSYTTGQTAPLSMGTAGGLRVDASGNPISVNQSSSPWFCSSGASVGGTTSGVAPIMIGGAAATATPAAATAGNLVNGLFDKVGKLITAGAIRTNKNVQKTSITVATETTVVTAGAAGVFNDVYAIVVTNKSATGVFVDFRDATAGTVRMTLSAPAGDTRGFTVPVDSAMVQAVAANNWTATVSSAVTSIEITMLYTANT